MELIAKILEANVNETQIKREQHFESCVIYPLKLKESAWFIHILIEKC